MISTALPVGVALSVKFVKTSKAVVIWRERGQGVSSDIQIHHSARDMYFDARWDSNISALGIGADMQVIEYFSRGSLCAEAPS